MFVVMMMAFEVKAWDSFEEANVDIAPWLYETNSTIVDWEDFSHMGQARNKTILIQEKKLFSGKTAVAITQKLINKSDTPYCVIARLDNKVNAINTFLRNGKTILNPSEEKLIGGYRVHTIGKNWKVQWKFIATKNLARCN
jgi:hypothetical protein